MCGICCILGPQGHQIISDQHYINENSRLYNRGPDCQKRLELPAPGCQSLVMCGSVLGLRGQLTPQPLTDQQGNVLLWNGEIFGGIQVPADGNDTDVLLTALSECHSAQELLQLVSTIEGPFSFVYWQVSTDTLWFGRDVLGRRSLLWHFPHSCDDVFVLSSVRISSMEFEEIPAVGIFSVKVNDSKTEAAYIEMNLFPWTCFPNCSSPENTSILNEEKKIHWKEKLQDCSSALMKSSFECDIGDFAVNSNLGAFNAEVPGHTVNLSVGEMGPVDYLHSLLEQEDRLDQLSSQLIDVLLKAVHTRVSTGLKSDRGCHQGYGHLAPPDTGEQSGESTPLVITTDQHTCSLLKEKCMLQQRPEIDSDLSERTRKLDDKKDSHARIAILFSGGLDSTVIAALADRCLPAEEPIDLLNVAFEQKQKQPPQRNSKNHSHSRLTSQTFDPFLVPDRETGLTALRELNPRRQWNFVQIDVTLEELKHYRQQCVSELLYPLCTVLDESIGCAVWFAVRGSGVVKSGHTDQTFTSEAKVVLVGMGADEQLAGYSRHRTKFQESGWEGLAQEIQMEVNRISTRNLGRDDRIITDHGKESRLPFLDENVVSFLNQIPIHLKANLTLPRGVGEKLLLRLCALKLGLPQTAVAPKRAIQFGSRIAKSENRKEHASDVCQRLQTAS